MDKSRRTVLIWLSLVFATLIVITPLYSQDTEEEPKSQSPDEVIPGFRGETVVKDGGEVDAVALLSQLTNTLGGREAFEGLKDLRFNFMQKYYLEGALRFIETADFLVQFGEHIKARIDYTNYPLGPSDLENMIVYREVVGEDGPFKFREGKVLRSPGAIREAGQRVLRYYFAFFFPFCLDFEEAGPVYLGRTSWKEETPQGKARDVTCHKILARIKGRQADIQGNVLALYIDTTSYELKRLAFVIPMPNLNMERTRIVDFKDRINVEGVSLPSTIDMTESRDNKFYAYHHISLSQYTPNTGLEGIGFEMINQEYLEKETKASKKGNKKVEGIK